MATPQPPETRPSRRYRRRKTLGEILKERGWATEAQVDECAKAAKAEGGVLGNVMVARTYITEQQLVQALAEQAGMPVVDLDILEVPRDVVDRVSLSIAEVYKIAPVKFENNILTVAMADPLHVQALDDLRFMLNCEVAGAVSTEAAVERAIKKYYAGQRESVEQLIKDIEESRDEYTFDIQYGQQSTSIDIEQLQELANSMPVVKLLNLILIQAIKDQSSDIHFEPFEDEFKVRYRVDGVLYEMMPPPRHLALAITSRIKVMSNLDIAETRLPQDGRIELNMSGNPVDLRISTLPCLHGESVVMRVLDRSVVSLDLQRIGLREDDMKTVKALVDKPHGIILCTGPTGSGKTTTLYSMLNYANDVGIKIITTEDPVEYDLEGIMQVQINEAIGVTFARCLRSILRQDPDKILVGEIRDLETAQIAIQSSLTGHIVLSTLHTNDAPTTITRLIDIGVEPFLICATLQAIIAQRLVRTICVNCKTPYAPSRDALEAISLAPDEMEGKNFCYGKGCQRCNNTGYRGRIAIFEIMIISDTIRELIMKSESATTLRAIARQEGMRTLRESGLLHIFDGITTIEEVVRETQVMV
jgi:type IV pilus assembly protein PilB